MFSKSKKPEKKDMVVAPVPTPPKDNDNNGTPKPLLSDKGAIGQLFKGFFGYNGNPTSTELLSWLLTLTLVSFLWKRASSPNKT